MSANAFSMPDLIFKNEQDFKTWCMRFVCPNAGDTIFEVENEEKEPGFPDLLKVDFMGRAFFYETKIAWKSGRFKFEKTQPKFYKSHPTLDIRILVWDLEKRVLYSIPHTEAADKALEKGSLTLNIREF